MQLCKCQKWIPDDVNFCAYCGRPSPSKMKALIILYLASNFKLVVEINRCNGSRKVEQVRFTICELEGFIRSSMSLKETNVMIRDVVSLGEVVNFLIESLPVRIEIDEVSITLKLADKDALLLPRLTAGGFMDTIKIPSKPKPKYQVGSLSWAADKLSVNEEVVKKLITAGKLKAEVIGDQRHRRYQVDVKSLFDLKNQNERIANDDRREEYQQDTL